LERDGVAAGFGRKPAVLLTFVWQCSGARDGGACPEHPIGPPCGLTVLQALFVALFSLVGLRDTPLCNQVAARHGTGGGFLGRRAFGHVLMDQRPLYPHVIVPAILLGLLRGLRAVRDCQSGAGDGQGLPAGSDLMGCTAWYWRKCLFQSATGHPLSCLQGLGKAYVRTLPVGPQSLGLGLPTSSAA